MDFARLSDDDLFDFLHLNEVEYGMDRPRHSDLAYYAKQTFDQIKDSEAPSFTTPVVDLYLSQLFLDQGGEIDQVYSEADLRNLDPETRVAFGQIFGLEGTEDDFPDRLVRILGFLNALEKPKPKTLPTRAQVKASQGSPGFQGSPGQRTQIQASQTQGQRPVLWSSIAPNLKRGEFPIPIAYPVSKRYSLDIIQQWRDWIGQNSGIRSDVSNFDVPQLRKLYQLYNEHFFNSALPATVNFSISAQMTRVAGKCGPCPGVGCECRYQIKMSRPIFQQLKLAAGQKTQSGGVECRTQLECLQLVLEHEMMHLAIRFVLPARKQLDKTIYSAHGQLFKQLVLAYFGQTQSTHSIGRIIANNELGQAISKERAKIGQAVAYQVNEKISKGVIVDINPVNAVLRLLDGTGRFVKYHFLHEINEEDDDYEELQDLSVEIKSKLRYYRGLQVGQQVQVRSIFKGQTEPQTYTGTVKDIKPRSDKITVSIPIGNYTFRYSELVLPSSQSPRPPATPSTTRPSSTSTPSTSRPSTTELGPPSSTLPNFVRSLSRAEVNPGSQVSFKTRDETKQGIVIKTNPVNAVVYTTDDEPWNIKYADLLSASNSSELQQLSGRLNQKRAVLSRLKVGDQTRVYFRQRGGRTIQTGTVTEPPKNEKVVLQIGGRKYKIEYLDLVV